MTKKITALLVLAAMIISFAMPAASAVELNSNCNLQSINLNDEALDELLNIADWDAETFSCDTADAKELMETLQNQLNTNCLPDEFDEMLENLKSEQVANNNCHAAEIPPEETKDTPTIKENDDMTLTMPTMEVEAEVDAQPIPTEDTQTVEPIPTQAPEADAEPINSIPAVEVTPLPTAEPTEVVEVAAAPEPTPAPEVAATPQPTAEPTTEPTEKVNTTGISDIERQMVAMVNEDRANAGLAPLTIDVELTTVAREHSADMSANNFFSHTSPTNGGFSERLRNSGISVMSGGENIAMYGSVAKAQAALMASDGHRANILGNFTHVGIGIVYNEAKGAYYITQWFGRK